MLPIFIHYIHALKFTYSDFCLRQLTLENNLLHTYLKVIPAKKKKICYWHFIYDRSKQSYLCLKYRHSLIILYVKEEASEAEEHVTVGRCKSRW